MVYLFYCTNGIASLILPNVALIPVNLCTIITLNKLYNKTLSISGLKGTIPISKLFNDTNRVEDILTLWSSKVVNGSSGAEKNITGMEAKV